MIQFHPSLTRIEFMDATSRQINDIKIQSHTQSLCMSFHERMDAFQHLQISHFLLIFLPSVFRMWRSNSLNVLSIRRERHTVIRLFPNIMYECSLRLSFSPVSRLRMNILADVSVSPNGHYREETLTDSPTCLQTLEGVSVHQRFSQQEPQNEFAWWNAEK